MRINDAGFRVNLWFLYIWNSWCSVFWPLHPYRHFKRLLSFFWEFFTNRTWFHWE